MVLMNKFKNLQLDNIYKGYRFLKKTDVPEFKLTALEFLHEKTNAKHIHLARDDKNKTFGVQFRTPPPNSCGVPHILEHTVLCGSKKYPVRDPFFKMLTRSQATFMNAMTANDWTLYPFSSINNTDFMNLLSVYLDAVFRPKLEEEDFMQEGWRLEPPESSNQSSEFLLKGVVYNEMKGVFSSGMSNLAYQNEINILPTTYAHISGGAPQSIPQLTHLQLKQFHAQLYHPSNSRFFTYGNMNVEDILEMIDSDYLSHYEMKNCSTEIEIEPKWNSPRNLDIHCQSDPMTADANSQNSVVLSFAVDDSRAVYLNFKVGLVSSLLIDGDNAPLYRALIESGLGQDWAPNLCGFDHSNRTSVFNIGLQGVHKDNMDKVQEVIFKVLEEVFRDGFPSERIDSLLHQIELSIRHDNASFGLRLIMGLSSGVNHDASLEDLLQTTEYIRRFNTDLNQNPSMLQDIVKKYILDNKHRLTVRMTPKSTFDDEKLEEEKKMVKQMNEKLTASEKAIIAEKCKKLLESQNKAENIDCLPCLQISDISRESERFPFRIISDQNLQINEYDTNGIMYLKMAFNLRGIDPDLLQYIPLFSSVVTSMSTSTMHYREISQAAESCSGGLNSGLNLSGNLSSLDQEDTNASLVLSSHCLYGNTSKLLNIWTNIIKEVEFSDVERLSTLIKMETASHWSSDGLSSSAQQFAMRRAVAHISPMGRLSEYWHGLEQGHLMKSLAKMSLTDIKEVLVPKLERLKREIFNRNRLKMAVNLESSAADSSANLLGLFAHDLQSKDFKNDSICLPMDMGTHTQFVLPYTVNYVATAIKSVPYHNPDYARTRVLSKLLSSKFLHKQIREIGGAYGSGAVATPGHFNFYSYRDPHSTETLNQFTRSFEWMLRDEISDQLMNEAKLSVFQEVDRPLSAGSKGQLYFMDGITDDMRQQQRDRLFEVSLKEVRAVAERLVATDSRSSVVIGPDHSLGDQWTKFQFNE